MGFSISWIAVRAGSETALGRLRLRAAGAAEGPFAAPLTGTALAAGWYLVVADRCDHLLVSEAVLARLSAETDVVACSIEEHVMASRAEYWSGGSERWSIRHDGQRGRGHLEVSGDLPAVFEEVRERLLAEQAAEDRGAAEVDYVFDVPLETARRIAGFKHDANEEPAGSEVLVPTEGSPFAARRRWWQLW